MLIEQARAEADAAGKLVGLAAQNAADLDRGRADGDAVADFQIEPRQQRHIDRRAVHAVALGDGLVERDIGLEHDLAEQRIGLVDRLDLDQRVALVGGARHRAHGGGGRHLAAPVEEGAFVGAGLAMDQRERDVAAENGAALACEPAGETVRQRADAGNRHHAERDAEHQHIEAA